MMKRIGRGLRSDKGRLLGAWFCVREGWGLIHTLPNCPPCIKMTCQKTTQPANTPKLIRKHRKCNKGQTQFAVGCPRGQYADKDTCYLCPIGSYQDSSASVECKPCPSGTSTASQGAISLTQCKGRVFLPQINLYINSNKYTYEGQSNCPVSCHVHKEHQLKFKDLLF